MSNRHILVVVEGAQQAHELRQAVGDAVEASSGRLRAYTSSKADLVNLDLEVPPYRVPFVAAYVSTGRGNVPQELEGVATDPRHVADLARLAVPPPTPSPQTSPIRIPSTKNAAKRHLADFVVLLVEERRTGRWFGRRSAKASAMHAAVQKTLAGLTANVNVRFNVVKESNAGHTNDINLLLPNQKAPYVALYTPKRPGSARPTLVSYSSDVQGIGHMIRGALRHKMKNALNAQLKNWKRIAPNSNAPTAAYINATRQLAGFDTKAMHQLEMVSQEKEHIVPSKIQRLSQAFSFILALLEVARWLSLTYPGQRMVQLLFKLGENYIPKGWKNARKFLKFGAAASGADFAQHTIRHDKERVTPPATAVGKVGALAGNMAKIPLMRATGEPLIGALDATFVPIEATLRTYGVPVVAGTERTALKILDGIKAATPSKAITFVRKLINGSSVRPEVKQALDYVVGHSAQDISKSFKRIAPVLENMNPAEKDLFELVGAIKIGTATPGNAKDFFYSLFLNPRFTT